MASCWVGAEPKKHGKSEGNVFRDVERRSGQVLAGGLFALANI